VFGSGGWEQESRENRIPITIPVLKRQCAD
jgi:hypothetical protein